MTVSSISPITLYGSSISYFTGKLENYFRIKGIPYTFQPLTARYHVDRVKQNTGSSQMPAIELADGRWMSDSTPIIQWFEKETPSPAVIPADPLARFFSFLLEDYADEWLWRPAMHYRWYYDRGARFAGTHLAEEIMTGMPIPGAVKRWAITRRQRNGYTRGDGIAPDQIAGVEAIYLRTLDQLEGIFRVQPFLSGSRPGLADVGFSGPFFRHFALDPVPAEIMRQRAPAVFEWVGRLWNATLEDHTGELLEAAPENWGPILDEIGSQYLPYLCSNVDAVAAGEKRFNAEIGGVQYRGARWSKYRVWCLQQLREHYRALSTADQGEARRLLQQHGCWEPLWRHENLPIDDRVCSQLPFHVDVKMIDVYD